MNNKLLEKLKETYPVGTKVRLLKMDDVQAPPIGTVGTVTHIDDLGTIFCAWETGSSLGVAYGEDIIEKIEPIVTIAYGKERTWKSVDEAIKYFVECILCSDGSEKERYERIVNKLKMGYQVCSDE